ncbi:AsnC family transcriptional regulator [uncultured Desulfovibrio sp.]|uniref:siroheme decarboxylase subunit alpha n=1 Tax=uncultured Desulfovibrio sp. TaxID=167968 RepID=UPI00263036F2|nr:AsnC family transcriptional regulator [uncultured Desulfovibrio sp.]
MDKQTRKAEESGALPPADNRMDSLDRQLLDIIQTDFPLTPRPYAELGQRLGIPEEEALERVRVLRRSKIIRRLGANFQSAKLGFVSTLCAAKVPEDKWDAFIAEVNARPGVTHNYLREHSYNFWFTLISPSREEAQAVLDDIRARTGVDIINLPATKLFKIRVDFRMGSEA